MARAEKLKAANINLDETKCHIKTSGSAPIKRSYFKGSEPAVEDIEIYSKGLYCFEKLVRIAFIQSIQDDIVLGQHQAFVDYVSDLSTSFESLAVSDWRPEQSATRMCDFMMSFYNLYNFQWKKHGRSTEKSLMRFLEVIRDCLDFGYLGICQKFESLPQDVKDTVNKTFFLANERIDEWHEERSTGTPAA